MSFEFTLNLLSTMSPEALLYQSLIFIFPIVGAALGETHLLFTQAVGLYKHFKLNLHSGIGAGIINGSVIYVNIVQVARVVKITVKISLCGKNPKRIQTAAPFRIRLQSFCAAIQCPVASPLISAGRASPLGICLRRGQNRAEEHCNSGDRQNRQKTDGNDSFFLKK